MHFIFDFFLDLFLIRFLSKKSKKTLAIIAITFLILSISGLILRLYVRERKLVNQTITEGKEIVKEITIYKQHHNKLPETLSDIIGNNPLKSKWLNDQWNNPYHYKIINSNRFILFSSGV